MHDCECYILIKNEDFYSVIIIGIALIFFLLNNEEKLNHIFLWSAYQISSKTQLCLGGTKNPIFS